MTTFGLALSPCALAMNPTENRINGVAEFLVERAHGNAVAMLQRDMKSNRFLKCYLPETYKSATSGNLQILLQSGPELWKRSVENDLQNFGTHLLLNKISSETFHAWIENIEAQYVTVLRSVTIQVAGKQIEVTSIPLKATAEERAAANSFYDFFVPAQNKIREVVAELETARASSTDCPSAPIIPTLKELGKIADDFKTQMKRFQKADVSFKSPVALPDASIHETIDALNRLDLRLKYYQDRIDEIRREGDLAVQMFKLDELIRDSIAAGENPLIAASVKEYDRFSRYALSLATLSTAESPDQAKAVLRQLAVPPVSYAIKREVNANKVMITAYFGAAGGQEFINGSSKGFGGLTVPLGLEYTRGYQKGSVSLLLAPLDFAHPVNQIVNARGSSAEFKDIFAPGAYLAYGFPDIPLLVGIGYSHGPSLTGDQQGNRGRGLAFVAMDLPLLNLY